MKQLKMYWIPGTAVTRYPLPDGYAFSAYNGTEADKLAWCDCCRNGLIGDQDGAEMFDKCIGEHTGDVRFLDHQGVHVGTVTAIYHPDKRIGNVHMVGIRTEWRGKGLNKYLCMLALDMLAKQDLKYIYLTTDEWRVPAIKGYLRAGFVPVDYDTDMPQRWAKVLRDLGLAQVTMVDDEGQNPFVLHAAQH